MVQLAEVGEDVPVNLPVELVNLARAQLAVALKVAEMSVEDRSKRNFDDCEKDMARYLCGLIILKRTTAVGLSSRQPALEVILQNSCEPQLSQAK